MLCETDRQVCTLNHNRCRCCDLVYEGSSAALTSYAPKPSLCYAKRIVKSAHSITIVVVVATSYRLGFGICSGEKSLLIEVDPKPHPERVFSSGWDAKEI